MDFFKNKTVIQLLDDVRVLQQPNLIFFPSDATIEHSLQLLLENGILCAPVIDEMKEINGIVDIKDFVEYVLLLYGKSRMSIKDLKPDPKGDLSVKNLINISGSNPLQCITSESSVFSVLEMFARTGLHKIIVVDLVSTPSDTPLSSLSTPASTAQTPSTSLQSFRAILSQAALLEFFRNNIHQFDDSPFYSTALDKRYLHTGVVTIDRSCSALEALEKIQNAGLNGIACIDHTEKGDIMIGNFSASDLLHFVDNLDDLQKPLSQFFSNSKDHGFHRIRTCQEKDSQLDILRSLIGNKDVGIVHRLYILDEDGKPTYVVSMTDIISSIYSTYVQHEI